MKISERAAELWTASRYKDRYERCFDECLAQACDEWQASVEERLSTLVPAQTGNMSAVVTRKVYAADDEPEELPE